MPVINFNTPALKLYSSSLSRLGGSYFANDHSSSNASSSSESEDSSSFEESDSDEPMVYSGSLSAAESILPTFQSLSFVEVCNHMISQVLPQFTSLVTASRLVVLKPTRLRIRANKQAHKTALKIANRRVRATTTRSRARTPVPHKHHIYKIRPAQCSKSVDYPEEGRTSSRVPRRRNIPTFENYNSDLDTSRESSPEPSSHVDYHDMVKGNAAADLRQDEKLSPNVSRCGVPSIHYTTDSDSQSYDKEMEAGFVPRYELLSIRKSKATVPPATSKLGKRSRSDDDSDEADDENSDIDRSKNRRKLLVTFAAPVWIPRRAGGGRRCPTMPITPSDSPMVAPIRIAGKSHELLDGSSSAFALDEDVYGGDRLKTDVV